MHPRLTSSAHPVTEATMDVLQRHIHPPAGRWQRCFASEKKTVCSWQITEYSIYGRLAMSSENHSPEQRCHVRHQLKENIFVTILGNYFKEPASVVDFNRKGIGLYTVCGGREPACKNIILDLTSDREQVLLRSLSARVVFTCETSPADKKTTEESSRRCGLKFVNLSALQKRQLDIIIKKYARHEPGNAGSFERPRNRDRLRLFRT